MSDDSGLKRKVDGLRRKTTIALFFAIALLHHFTIPLCAKEVGADFLKITVGGRSAGMGSVFSALDGDVNALYGNPAGLAGVSRTQISASHTEWISDTRLDAVGFAVPTSAGTLGVGAVYFWQDALSRRNASGQDGGQFNAYDAAATLSWARALSSRLRGGVDVKYVRQTIDDLSAEGVAADAGLQVRVFRRWTAGLAVRNAGPPLRYIEESYRLPMKVTAGLSLFAPGGLTLGADINRDVYMKKWSANVGSEFRVFNTLALRAGFQSQFAESAGGASASNDLLNERTGARLGLGFRLFHGQMDYAFNPLGDLGGTHTLSLTVSF